MAARGCLQHKAANTYVGAGYCKALVTHNVMSAHIDVGPAVTQFHSAGMQQSAHPTCTCIAACSRHQCLKAATVDKNHPGMVGKALTRARVGVALALPTSRQC
jgi:hypothetical protein